MNAGRFVSNRDQRLVAGILEWVSFLENPAENLRHRHQWIKHVGTAPLPRIRNRPDVPPVSLGSRTRSPSRTTTQRGSCRPWVAGDRSCPESTPTFYLIGQGGVWVNPD
jgi:hypothetical protein